MRTGFCGRGGGGAYPPPRFTGRGRKWGRAPLPETLHALSRPHREPHPPPPPKKGGGEAPAPRAIFALPTAPPKRRGRGSRKPAKLLSLSDRGRRRVATMRGVDPEKPDTFLYRKSSGGLTSAASGERCNPTSRRRGRSNKSSGRMNIKRPTREPEGRSPSAAARSSCLC